MLKGIKPRRPQNSMGSWNSPVLETGFILVKCGARALRDCAHHLGDRWDALKGDWNAALETARLGFSALKWAHKKRRSRRGDADCRLEASRASRASSPQTLKPCLGCQTHHASVSRALPLLRPAQDLLQGRGDELRQNRLQLIHHTVSDLLGDHPQVRVLDLAGRGHAGVRGPARHEGCSRAIAGRRAER